MRQVGEPSVEEILESIKKVIARDNRDTAAVERQRRESIVVPDDFEDGGEDGDGIDGSVLELSDAAEIIEDSEKVTEWQGLLGEEAERSMRESLAELEVLSQTETGPATTNGTGPAGTSLEGMVREMLRPMLAQWLDQHMPTIVERLVKAEIARLKG